MTSADRLVLPAAIAAEMLAHAAAEMPNEACGLVAGDAAQGLATRFHPARNAAESPYVYELHPQDLVRLVHGIEADGFDLVAIFHSHPRTDAVPSPTDLRDAECTVVSIVAGVVAGRRLLRAWRIRDGRAREVVLQISA